MVLTTSTFGSDAARWLLGGCGGDLGPIGGMFVVQSHAVEMFLIEEKSLGTRSVAKPAGPPISEGDELGPLPNIAVNHAGRFTFTGTTDRQTSTDKSRKVKVQLSGTFVSATSASVSLKIHYKRCGTTHIIVHEA